MNNLLTEDEVKTLTDTRSAMHWNIACDNIKRARGGQYPEDWYDKILASGLMFLIQSGWVE